MDARQSRLNEAAPASLHEHMPHIPGSGLSKYYKDTQTTRRHAKSHKDTQRRAKTCKDTQIFACLCPSLCVFVNFKRFFLLHLRVFVCLCASLPVFARLCMSLRSLGVFAVFR